MQVHCTEKIDFIRHFFFFQNTRMGGVWLVDDVVIRVLLRKTNAQVKELDHRILTVKSRISILF